MALGQRITSTPPPPILRGSSLSRLLPARALLALLFLAAALLCLSTDSIQAQEDTARPTITAGPVITSSPQSGDTYGRGESVAVAVTFSEAVTVTGEPRVRLAVGERVRWARYSSGDGATLTFAYTVRTNDRDEDGLSLKKNAVKLNGGSVADADGNAAKLKHPALADQSGHKVAGSPAEQSAEPEPPTVSAGPAIASSPASGDTYGKGEAIVISLTFSEAVTVTGEPRVRLAVGDRDRWARYSSGDGATTLTFAYTVRINDRDEDGVSLKKNALKLNAGSIADADGNAAKLKHSALGNQAGHKVDGSRKSAPAAQQQQQQPPANSAPQFASENATLSVNEDAAVGTNVGAAITATDADGDLLIYALTGSNAFAIDPSGQITVKSALDYETAASYLLTVSVSDGKNASGAIDPAVDDTIAVAVSVGNVDEAGAIILESATDPPDAESSLTASLSDPDGGLSGTAWSWQRSADGTAWETVADATAATYALTNADAGYYLRATAGYTDAHGAGKTAVSAAAGPVAGIVTRQEPEAQAQTTLPSAPRLGTATATGKSGEVKLTWTDTTVGTSTATITGWQYKYNSPSDNLVEHRDVPWKDMRNVASTTTTYTVTGLVDFKVYHFWIRAAAATTATTTYSHQRQFQEYVVPLPPNAVTPGQQTVAYDWPYKPAGLEEGDKFRLLFVTDDTTAATQTGIAYYNTFVQRAAARNADLVNSADSSISGNFRALVSVGAEGGAAFVHARDNTRSTAPSMPIYWLGGEKIADGYDDGFYYSGDFDPWESYAGRTETGKSYAGEVWTGTQDAIGYAGFGGTTAGHPDGATHYGSLTDDFGDYYPIRYVTGGSSEKRPLYAMSPALVVGAKAPVAPATPNLRYAEGLVGLHGTVRFVWSRIKDPTITHWQVFYRKLGETGGTWRDIPGSHAKTTSHFATGLENDSEYIFWVRAVYSGGAGPKSNWRRATPKWPPDTKLVHGVRVTKLKVTPGDDSIKLSWTKRGRNYCGYVIKWTEFHRFGYPLLDTQQSHEFGAFSGDNPRYTITGLKPGTSYLVEVYVSSGYTNIPAGLAWERKVTTNN